MYNILKEIYHEEKELETTSFSYSHRECGYNVLLQAIHERRDLKRLNKEPPNNGCLPQRTIRIRNQLQTVYLYITIAIKYQLHVGLNFAICSVMRTIRIPNSIFGVFYTRSKRIEIKYTKHLQKLERTINIVSYFLGKRASIEVLDFLQEHIS